MAVFEMSGRHVPVSCQNQTTCRLSCRPRGNGEGGGVDVGSNVNLYVCMCHRADFNVMMDWGPDEVSSDVSGKVSSDVSDKACCVSLGVWKRGTLVGGGVIFEKKTVLHRIPLPLLFYNLNDYYFYSSKFCVGLPLNI